jgi:hypothetical protein
MNTKQNTTVVTILIGALIALAVVVAVVALVRLDTTGKKGSGLGKEYLYEIDTTIDPNLILYEESPEHFVTGFKAARAIAIDSKGNMYIAGDKAISIHGYVVGDKGSIALSSGGDLPGSIKLTDMPRCLTVADDGKIYVGMKDHVEVYDSRGKRLAIWASLGERAVLTSIAVSRGNVFIADAGNRIVLRYDTTGRLINRIGDKDEARNIPGFVIPSPYFDLAVRRDELLRVVNPGLHRIEAYTLDGDLEFWWGKYSLSVEGFCGCCNPANFAVLADDSFVTCEKGLARIKIYDPEGAFVGVVAGPEQLGVTPHICATPAQCQSGGFDVAVDEHGRIFVLDTINNVVKIFTRKKAE